MESSHRGSQGFIVLDYNTHCFNEPVTKKNNLSSSPFYQTSLYNIVFPDLATAKRTHIYWLRKLRHNLDTQRQKENYSEHILDVPEMKIMAVGLVSEVEAVWEPKTERKTKNFKSMKVFFPHTCIFILISHITLSRFSNNQQTNKKKKSSFH